MTWLFTHFVLPAFRFPFNAVAKDEVAERFGENRKVKQDMLGSFLRHGLSQEQAESEAVFQM